MVAKGGIGTAAASTVNCLPLRLRYLALNAFLLILK
jgi:hypothetical protein